MKRSERVFLHTSARVVLALLWIINVCGQTRAQSANATQLQKETEDLKAQLNALEGKINLKKAPAAPPTIASDKAPQPMSPPSSLDTKLHLGGVTITPGGFLELDGIARQRAQ